MDEQLEGQMSIFDYLTDNKIKAKYVGITCWQTVKGQTYDVEIDFDKFIVFTQGKDYKYHFRYDSIAKLKADWEF